MFNNVTKFALYDKTAAQLIVAHPCTLVQLDGNYGGGGSEYLQIFDKATVAVANDVPVASFLLSGAGPLPSIFETISTLPLANGLSIGISSTNEKYTASASAFDVFGATEGIIELPEGYLTATSTGSVTLDVWTTGNHKLLRFSVFNNETIPTWLMIFANSTLANQDGSIPMAVFGTLDGTAGGGPIADQATITRDFGRVGLTVQQLSSNRTLLTNCTLVLSSTPAVLNQSTGVDSTFTAYYI